MTSPASDSASAAQTAPASGQPSPSLRGLYAALGGIDRPLLREFSAKSLGGGLREGRVLLSFPREALGPGPARVLRGICRDLGAPDDGFAPLAAWQGQAVAVHFGFEPESDGPMIKCYLEFPSHAQPEPEMVFLALKWRSGGKHVLSRYWRRDGLTPAAQLDLVDTVLPEGARRTCLHTLLDMGGGTDTLRLLEVEEPGAPRRSLDLNLSEMGARVGDQKTLLVRLLGGSEIARRYVDRHARDRLGHVAAGTARDGRAFSTLYHGVHRVTGPLA